MIIAFDFDGTITKHNTYPTCEQLREGIANCIRQLFIEGHYIIIFTCRDTGTQEQLDAYNTMVNYLRNNKIPYNVINKNVRPSFDFNPTKPYWNILVDDSALGFNDEWTGEDIYKLIKEKLNI